MRAIFFLSVITMLLTACDAKYTDVSGATEYSDKVGQICTTRKPFFAYGYTIDLNNRKTDAISLYAQKMADRAYHTFSIELKVGSKLAISAVRECWNCPFDRISYEVTAPGYQELSKHQIYASEKAMGKDNIQCISASIDHRSAPNKSSNLTGADNAQSS